MIKRNFAIRIHGSNAWYITGVTALVSGITATKIVVPKAEPKTNYFDILGRDGAVDRSEAYGAVFYNNRTITISCCVKRGCSFDYDEFAAMFNGRRVDVVDQIANGTVPADAYYYTGRLSMPKDDGMEKLRGFDLVINAEPYSYAQQRSGIQAEPTISGMEYIRLHQMQPESSNLSRIAGYSYNDYRTVYYGDMTPGHTGTWKHAVTSGHRYTMSIAAFNVVVEIFDSHGNTYNPNGFIASEGYIYIRVNTLRGMSGYSEISISEAANASSVTSNRYTELFYNNPNPSGVVKAVVNGSEVALRHSDGREPVDTDPQLYLSPGSNTIVLISSSAQNSPVKLAWVEGRL